MRSDPSGSTPSGPEPAPEAASGPASSRPPAASHPLTSTGFDTARDLVSARDRLLHGGSRTRPLDASGLREALVELYEFWLTGAAAGAGITADSGFALLAVGGLGRRDLAPYSDLDLVLLHDDLDPELVAATADSLWYPLWDAHIGLDHSVRTVPQALRVAASDTTAMLGLLEARHIAGDTELSTLLIGGVRRQWRRDVRERFDDLLATTHARWKRGGQIAHRAEPDLKHGRGGLRDVHLLSALAKAQLTDDIPPLGPDSPGGGVAAAHARLLDVRTELHRAAGRARDELRAQDADEIAAALRLGDRFDLARTLTEAARTVSYSVDVGIRTAANSLPRTGLSRWRRGPVRRPLDEGVVEHAGEVALARDATPSRDPGLVVRVGAAAARSGLPIAASTLGRLADYAPEPREPWSRELLGDFLALLGAGAATVDVVEALDRTGLWGRLIPEWGAVRDLPPRDAVHTWTVDRHLVETVVRASTLATRVRRPDLLLVGALIHDLGKGRGGDHSVLGADLAVQIGRRLGLWPTDVATVSAIVRHHLLLPQTATRRDLDDPATVAAVVDAIDGDPVLLEILWALAEADSLATGPGVWGDWKASLIAELVRRCMLVMRGEDLPTPDPVDPALLASCDGGVHVTLTPAEGLHSHTVTVVAPDGHGLLSAASGVLALHGLRVLSASVASVDGAAVDTFVVAPAFGAPPAEGLLRQDLVRAVDGRLDVAQALRRRDTVGDDRPRASGAVAVPAADLRPPARIVWPTAVDGDRVVEVRAPDRAGLLADLAGALESVGVDVRWAKVVTYGAVAVDVFGIDAGADTHERRGEIDAALLGVLDDRVSGEVGEQDGSGPGGA